MRKFFAFVYLFLPSILVSAPIWGDVFAGSSQGLGFVVFVYLITIIGIILFFKYKPCGFYVLILGLLLSPLYPILWAVTLPFEGGVAMHYVFAVLSALFYALPFMFISIIVFFVVRAKNKRVQ